MMSPAEIRNLLAVYDDACHFYFSRLPLLMTPPDTEGITRINI
jgi:hypothetical protein